MKSLEEKHPMHRSPILARILIITILFGLIVITLGSLSSASAIAQVDVKVDSNSDDTLESAEDGGPLPPTDVDSTVDGVTGSATGLVRDTTGVDADLDGVGDTHDLLPSEGATDSAVGSTSQSQNEPRPLTTEDAATAGVLAAASGAGFLFWLQNVLGIGLGRLFMAPMFSRIEKNELLNNEGRDVLMTLIDENPGIGLKDLSERAGLGWGTTVYHMSRLEAAGFVASMKNGQNRHFFKNGHPAALMKDHVAVLRNQTAGNVARFLLATPGSTQTTIAKRLGLGAPTVTKYVKRMERQGLVQVVQDGRSKIVQPTGALQSALDHAAPMPEVPRQTGVLTQRSAVGVA